MRDINDILPKIPSMKWGALLNRPPTNERVNEMSKIFPNNGKWHTVFDIKNHVIVDGKWIQKSESVWT